MQQVFQQWPDDALVTWLDRRGRPVQVFTGSLLLQEAMVRAAMLEAAVPTRASCLLVMPAGPEFLLTLLGCLFAGLVAIPLPEPSSGAHAERLAGVLQTSGASAVLCVSTNSDTLAALLTEARPETNCQLIAMDVAERTNDLPACAGMLHEADETVIVQYTSGSTRSPKGIALSSRNVLSNATLIQQEWRLAPGTVSVNWLPHYHDMGLLGGLLYPLLIGEGFHSVQMSPLAFLQHPMRWLQAISEFRAAVSGGPAFALGLCVDHITDDQLRQMDLSCWKTAFCGAEPISMDALERFRLRFHPAGFEADALYATYGLAESTLFVAGHRLWPGEATPQKPGQTRIAPSRLSARTRALFRIVDPETLQPVPDGTIGEVWVTGPSVSCGYLPAETGTDEVSTFGVTLPGDTIAYLRSGDLGWVSSTALYISGRRKDMLIANGVNVAATDVEWLAAEHEPLLNPLAAAAVALRVDEGCEGAALMIEVRTSNAALPQPSALADRIRKAVHATYGIDLRQIQFLRRGSLERTTSGKIRRSKVAEQLKAGHAYPQAATTRDAADN
ncbi:MAG: AMP-binding protein [Janthinobacterium lividum]